MHIFRLPQIASTYAKLACWVCISLFSCLCTTTLSAQNSPPHIIVFLADDLGWGDVGYHGSRIATPHIDKLAMSGTQLNQFYVQPVCTPTRGALLTGRYPIRLGLQCGVIRPWAQHGLPLDERTLPAALKEIGYETAIVGKWHLGHHRPDFLPLQRGFDQQYGHYNGALDYFTHIRDGGFDWHQNDRRNDDPGYTTEILAGEAVRIIAEHERTKPLFLYIPFNAPHTPLQAPQEYLERYADWPNKRRATYAAMVSCLDDAIGKIVGALDEYDFSSRNTLIFFSSDNGGIPQLGSNGELRAGKGTLYEGGVRVPAFMVWEGRLAPNSIVDEPLHIVDLYPTLLNLAGAGTRQPKSVDGHDAWPTIADGQPSPHQFILHNATPYGGALRMGPWKLIHNGHVRANAVAGTDRQSWELFNLADDPYEKNDVKTEHPLVFEKMKVKLADLAEAAVPPNIPPNQAPQDFQVPEVWGEFD